MANAATEPRPEKPYKFDTIAKPVSQTDMVMWQSTLWDFLKSTPKFKPLLKKDLTWTTDDANNRGFVSDAGTENPKLTAGDKSDLLDSILLKIGTYGPKSAFIDITQRSTSWATGIFATGFFATVIFATSQCNFARRKCNFATRIFATSILAKFAKLHLKQ